MYKTNATLPYIVLNPKLETGFAGGRVSELRTLNSNSGLPVLLPSGGPTDWRSGAATSYDIISFL